MMPIDIEIYPGQRIHFRGNTRLSSILGRLCYNLAHDVYTLIFKMIDEQTFKNPGEFCIVLDGNAGSVEAIVTIPEEANSGYFAVIGHPHSLQGGSMNNKVVTTLARMFRDLGVASLRFNFRGVGQSEGEYDDGIGESDDMLLILNELKKRLPRARFFLAGFSFGSYVAYRAACQFEHHALISVAPPVTHYDFNAFSKIPSPWIVIQGSQDEVIEANLVYEFFNSLPNDVTMLQFSDTTHFFHGKLVELKQRLSTVIERLM